MKRFRFDSVLLTLASLMTLAACGDEDSTTAAGSAPSASAAPSSPAASASASASASATGTLSDKELCNSAKKAGDDMKAKVIAAVQSGGDPAPAVFKEILGDLEEKVTALASAGGDGKVPAAMKRIAAEAGKAAAAADPATAADNPAFEKAGKDLTAACKAAGVNVIF